MNKQPEFCCDDKRLNYVILLSEAQFNWKLTTTTMRRSIPVDIKPFDVPVIFAPPIKREAGETCQESSHFFRQGC